jgi:6-pyruvoyltetrahydropterin/6-carboxytetrahydropterin synthase
MSSYIEIDGWRSNIRFSSAHIIHEYEKCGRLHGHTYALHIKIWGKPDSKGIIVDFSYVKQVLKQIASSIDHRLLVPEKSSIVEIDKKSNCIKINAMGKSYKFPLSDCVLLPIKSTSAENLANFILEEFIKKTNNLSNVTQIEIGLDEGFGQGARICKKLRE